MTMGRGVRLVTTQDGEAFVSASAVSRDDAEAFLALECTLHRLTGWSVRAGGRWIVARRGTVVRTVRAMPEARAVGVARVGHPDADVTPTYP